jgi:hypothetical protein
MMFVLETWKLEAASAALKFFAAQLAGSHVCTSPNLVKRSTVASNLV